MLHMGKSFLLLPYDLSWVKALSALMSLGLCSEARRESAGQREVCRCARDGGETDAEDAGRLHRSSGPRRALSHAVWAPFRCRTRPRWPWSPIEMTLEDLERRP
jgi:hypothetical protein